MSSQQCDIAVYGMGVMGANLAMNIASRGHHVAIGNRSADRLAAAVDQAKEEDLSSTIHLHGDLASMVSSLKQPRMVIIMVAAGKAVDAVTEQLYPLLSPGDIVCDCGNEHFETTARREAAALARGVVWMGVGVSGGEEGARHGPAMMVGGDPEGYKRLYPILSSIAAHGSENAVSGSDSGSSDRCISYCGPGGAGHFVKMVHNGIEYGDMQAIAETLSLLRARWAAQAAARGDAPAHAYEEVKARLRAAAAALAAGPLGGFLLDITRDILDVDLADADALAPPSQALASPLAAVPRAQALLLDDVGDAAAMKGTGTWTVLAAAKLAVPVSVLASAVDARALSSSSLRSAQSVSAAPAAAGDDPVSSLMSQAAAAVTPEAMLGLATAALTATRLVAYAQGLALIHAAAQQHGWATDMRSVVLGWRGGCIIRAKVLPTLAAAADAHSQALLRAPEVAAMLEPALSGLRTWTTLATWDGAPVPAAAAALNYVTMLRSERLPTAWVQAQRDCFGAHTYVSVTAGKATHTQWAAAAETGRKRRAAPGQQELGGGKKIKVDRVHEERTQM